MKGPLIYVPAGGERTGVYFIDCVYVVYLITLTASNTIFQVSFWPHRSHPPTRLQTRQIAQVSGPDPKGLILLLPPLYRLAPPPRIRSGPTSLSLLSPIPGAPDTLQGPASLFSSPWPPRCRPGLPNRPQPRTVRAAPLRGGGRANDLSGLAALTHWLALGQKVYRATWPVRSAMLVM